VSEDDLNESELAAQTDPARAATTVIESYGPAILGYLTTLLDDDDDAADVFSMFSEDVWRGISGFRQECSLKSWCYKVAWHAAMRFKRDLYRQRGVRLDSTAVAQLAARVRSTTALHLRSAIKDRVRQLRAGLADDEQTILILRIDRGLSWREVAHVLSTPELPIDEAALRKRFERLKTRLRELARTAGLDTQ